MLMIGTVAFYTSRLPGKTGRETYSSGYCPGFAPDSLFIPVQSIGNQLPAAKVAQ